MYPKLDKHFAWIVGSGLLLALAFPVIWAALFPPADWQLYRAWALGDDYTQYRSAMAQGYAGDWLIVNRFTPEPHAPVLQYPFYVLLGHLARLFHAPLEWLYYGACIAGSAALLWALGAFTGAFLPGGRARKLAWLLTFSVGPGWLLAIGTALFPACVWCTRYDYAFNRSEVNTWLLLSAPPHLALSLAGMLWLWADFWQRREAGFSRTVLSRYAFLIVVTGLVNPFCLIPALLPIGVWWVGAVLTARRVLWSLAQPLIVMGLAALPLLTYNYRAFALDPFWGRAYGSQNLQASLPLDGVLWGYGIASILAIWTAFRHWRMRAEGRFLLTLALVLLVSSYIPVTYQRRFGFGLGPIIAVLAAPAWSWMMQWRWVRKLRHRMLGRVTVSVALVMLFWGQNLAYYAAYTSAHLGLEPTPRFVFQPHALAAAADYLHELGSNIVVLAYEPTGNLLAGEIQGRVVLGHAGATLDVNHRREQVAAFFGDRLSLSEQNTLLTQWRVTHIIVSPLTDDDLTALVWRWPIVFAEADVAIYAVAPF